MPRSFPTDHPLKFEDRLGGLGLAADLVLKKKFAEAKQVLEKVLELSPDDTEIMSLLANIYIIEGNFKKAEEWLDKVLSIKPDYPQALLNKGVAYHKKGEFEEAIKMFEKAIKNLSEDKKEDIADVYQNLGCSLWEVRRREDALEAWRTSLKYNSKQKYAKRNLRKFTNKYGLPKSPVGMDDFWAFMDFKQKEYFSVKGKDNFDDTDEFNFVLRKIRDAWNTQIPQKYGRKLDRMKTKEKIKLFNEIKVFI
jgi:tetratricopeptide (TPR) repeat protein